MTPLSAPQTKRNATSWIPETRLMTVNSDFFHSHKLTKLSTLIRHGRVSQHLLSSCYTCSNNNPSFSANG